MTGIISSGNQGDIYGTAQTFPSIPITPAHTSSAVSARMNQERCPSEGLRLMK